MHFKLHFSQDSFTNKAELQLQQHKMDKRMTKQDDIW